jgi:host factor-I protein
MKGMINLQDTFLNQARKENMLTTVFLVNGYQIKGVVRSFDNFTLLLEVEGKQQLVYKHAVSTIIPMRNVNLRTNDNDDAGDEEEEKA